MRKLRALLLGLTILTGAGVVPAGAQMAVIDGSNLAQTTLAAQRALNQIQQLTAQYNQLVATYQMLTNPTDVLSMATGLSVPTLQNPLPSANLLNGLVSGQTAASANLQSIQQRLALLPTLVAALSGATSITQVDAINGRIAVEANYVQAQQAQAQNLSILASQQEASARQQAQEEHAREANAIAAQYKAGAQ